MTKGEKIKEMFPSMIVGFITESKIGIYFVKNQHSANVFDLEWWNAEYIEPTTENCIACKYDEIEGEDGEHCKKCLAGDSQFELDKEFVEPTTKNDLGVDTISRADAERILTDLYHSDICDYCLLDILEDIKALPSVTPQEPILDKPCVSAQVCEHDKQKLLDKIRAEIKALSPEPTAYDVIDGNPIKDAVWETIADVLKIIDKYKAESEE